MRIKGCGFVKLKFIDDGIDGNLVVAENFKHIPFAIKRVYFIKGLSSKGAIRGYHAHKKLKQVIFCINGSFRLDLDDGRNKDTIVLKKSDKGVYMGGTIWRTMKDFSEDCIILVLASDIYKESDYIRDYRQFLKYVKDARARKGK